MRSITRVPFQYLNLKYYRKRFVPYSRRIYTRWIILFTIALSSSLSRKHPICRTDYANKIRMPEIRWGEDWYAFLFSREWKAANTAWKGLSQPRGQSALFDHSFLSNVNEVTLFRRLAHVHESQHRLAAVICIRGHFAQRTTIYWP